MKIKIQPISNCTLSAAAEQFIRQCKIKNLSPHSISDYQSKLKILTDFYGDNPISTFSLDTLNEFTYWLKTTRQLNDISINSYLRTARAFLYFCMERGIMDSFKVRLPKADEALKETYSHHELTILLKHPDRKNSTFAEYRDWAAVNLLLGTGCRISTAVNILIGDLDFDNGVITLQKTKNRKKQVIPMGTTLQTVLKEYLLIRGGTSEDYVICTQYGEKLAVHSLQSSIKRYNHHRGIERTSLHAFRHSFARDWILNGGDVFRLQRIMGHADISTTKQYVQLYGADLAKDYDKYNALDRLSQTHNSHQRITLH